MRVFNFLRSPLVAIDVGTAATRVSFAADHLVESPSSVSEDVDGALVTRSTMRGGVVADIAGAAAVLSPMLRSGRKHWWSPPAALVCAPSDASSDERDALAEAVSVAGASVAAIVPEPLAAAIGAGIDVASEYATAIVDVGEGVTDVAVIRNAAMIHAAALRVGCGKLREAIRDWAELQQQLALAEQRAEEIVRTYCRTAEDQSRIWIDTADGTRMPVDRDDIAALLDPVIETIAEFIGRTLRELPDNVSAEIIESGVRLTGGGAELRRLVERIDAHVGLPVQRAKQPAMAVIRGAREMLKNRRLIQTGM